MDKTFLIPIVSQTHLCLEILHHQKRASGIVEVYIKTSWWLVRFYIEG